MANLSQCLKMSFFRSVVGAVRFPSSECATWAGVFFLYSLSLHITDVFPVISFFTFIIPYQSETISLNLLYISCIFPDQQIFWTLNLWSLAFALILVYPFNLHVMLNGFAVRLLFYVHSIFYKLVNNIVFSQEISVWKINLQIMKSIFNSNCLLYNMDWTNSMSNFFLHFPQDKEETYSQEDCCLVHSLPITCSPFTSTNISHITL